MFSPHVESEDDETSIEGLRPAPLKLSREIRCNFLERQFLECVWTLRYEFSAKLPLSRLHVTLSKRPVFHPLSQVGSLFFSHPRVVCRHFNSSFVWRSPFHPLNFQETTNDAAWQQSRFQHLTRNFWPVNRSFILQCNRASGTLSAFVLLDWQRWNR